MKSSLRQWLPSAAEESEALELAKNDVIWGQLRRRLNHSSIEVSSIWMAVGESADGPLGLELQIHASEKYKGESNSPQILKLQNAMLRSIRDNFHSLISTAFRSSQLRKMVKHVKSEADSLSVNCTSMSQTISSLEKDLQLLSSQKSHVQAIASSMLKLCLVGCSESLRAPPHMSKEEINLIMKDVAHSLIESPAICEVSFEICERVSASADRVTTSDSSHVVVSARASRSSRPLAHGTTTLDARHDNNAVDLKMDIFPSYSVPIADLCVDGHIVVKSTSASVSEEIQQTIPPLAHAIGRRVSEYLFVNKLLRSQSLWEEDSLKLRLLVESGVSTLLSGSATPYSI